MLFTSVKAPVDNDLVSQLVVHVKGSSHESAWSDFMVWRILIETQSSETDPALGSARQQAGGRAWRDDACKRMHAGARIAHPHAGACERA